MPAISSTLKNISAHAKAHHESVNAAYEAFYGIPPRPSLTQTRNNSSSSEASTSSKSSTGMNKAWKSIKKAAKEHHEGVNAAYVAFYGIGASRSAGPEYRQI